MLHAIFPVSEDTAHLDVSGRSKQASFDIGGIVSHQSGYQFLCFSSHRIQGQTFSFVIEGASAADEIQSYGLSEGDDVFLSDEVHRSDQLHRLVILRLKFWKHSLKRAGAEKIHQRCIYHVVVMMSQCDLIASQFIPRYPIKATPSHLGAQRARILGHVVHGFEDIGVDDLGRQIQYGQILFYFIQDVFSVAGIHNQIFDFKREVRIFVKMLEKKTEGHRIFSTRNANADLIVRLDQIVFVYSMDEFVPQSFFVGSIEHPFDFFGSGHFFLLLFDANYDYRAENHLKGYPCLYRRSKDMTNDEYLRKIWFERDPYSYKGDWGKALVIAGSLSYPGAAVLASKFCSLAGPGYSCLQTSASAFPLVFPQLIPETIGIMEDDRDFALGCDSILFGNGMEGGTNNTSYLFDLLRFFSKTIIVDASGLRMIAADPWILNCERPDSQNLVFTPHPGEAEALLSSDNLIDDKDYSGFAAHHHVWFLLKGTDTILYRPDGSCVSAKTIPCPALAKAGSGDMLAGLICGTAAYAGKKTGLGLEDVILQSATTMNRAALLSYEKYGAALTDSNTLEAAFRDLAKSLSLKEKCD